MLQLLKLARENAALRRELARIRGEAEQVDAMAEALELSGLSGARRSTRAVSSWCCRAPLAPAAAVHDRRAADPAAFEWARRQPSLRSSA